MNDFEWGLCVGLVVMALVDLWAFQRQTVSALRRRLKIAEWRESRPK